MNRRDIIFLGILFLVIIVIGMLYISYFIPLFEGFDKGILVDIQSQFFDSSLGNIQMDISNNIKAEDKNTIISQYILPIGTDLSNILKSGYCNNNNCTNVPFKDIQSLEHDIYKFSDYANTDSSFKKTNTINEYIPNITNYVNNLNNDALVS
jgi:hypothetical protein